MDASEASAWQTTHQLALDVYRATAQFPASERDGLAEQMRRAAALLPIAMAQMQRQPARRQRGYLLLLMDQAVREWHYYVTLAQDLDYLAPHLAQVIERDADEVLWHLRRCRDGSVGSGALPVAANGRVPALAERP